MENEMRLLSVVDQIDFQKTLEAFNREKMLLENMPSKVVREPASVVKIDLLKKSVR